MIRRGSNRNGRQSVAVYSDCECYRYSLTRSWNAAQPKLLFIMLNPSTATEQRNDPTVARCESRALDLGYGSFRVVNLFALRATDPSELKRHPAPVGPDNDAILRQSVTRWKPDLILCAWGTHGIHLDRDKATLSLLMKCGADLWTLGLTQGGQPRHPLYLPKDLAPQSWTPSASPPPRASAI